MEEKIDTKVNLSNDGFTKLNIAGKSPKELIFNIEEGKGVIKLEPCISTKILIENKDEYKNYLKRFKEIVSRNKIKDTDKVFFTKSSEFPRTSFNRYSTKARLIQNMEKADKIVIDINKVNFHLRALPRVIMDSNAIQFNARHINNTLIADNFSGNDSILNSMSAKRNYYGFNSQAINELVVNLLKRDFPSSVIEMKILHTVVGGNIIEENLLNLLYSGTIPISKIIIDKEANRYIDNFKGVLDQASYKLLLNALSKGSSNINMGFKLLENIDIASNLPKFYSLMVHSIFDNYSNIKNNKLYNSTGIKNLRAAYSLDSLLEFNYYGISKGLDIIGNIYNVLESPSDKVEFRYLINSKLHICLKETVGNKAYSFLNLSKLPGNENN